MNRFVISVKQIKNCMGESIPAEWVYAHRDVYSGPFSTGYPIFGSFRNAIMFESEEEATGWFKQNAPYMNFSSYDINSLNITKLIFKPSKGLKSCLRSED